MNVYGFKNFTFFNTPEFSLKDYEVHARVVSVYDGDTIVVVFPLFYTGKMYKFSVRLSGIDSCEIKSKNEDTRHMALSARGRLIQLITGVTANGLNTKKEILQLLNNDVYIVYLKCGDFDKYGRLLADVYLPGFLGKSLSQILVEEKLAYVYDGGKKYSEDEQLNILAKK